MTCIRGFLQALQFSFISILQRIGPLLRALSLRIFTLLSSALTHHCGKKPLGPRHKGSSKSGGLQVSFEAIGRKLCGISVCSALLLTGTPLSAAQSPSPVCVVIRENPSERSLLHQTAHSSRFNH